jgi:hypothetical protein
MKDLLARKKRENVAAYVISMWHLEDLLRAHQLEPGEVRDALVEPMDGDAQQKATLFRWYHGLIERMRAEGIEEHGHLDEVEQVVEELEQLHLTLLDEVGDTDYEERFQRAEPGIRAVQQQAGENPPDTIEACFTAVYGVMLLRTQDRPVSEATAEADRHIRDLLEHLSVHYRRMRRLPGVSLN